MWVGKIIDQNVKKIFESKEHMDFTDLLVGLRKAYGRTRRTVCREMPFSEMRMFCLENGLFRRPIPDEEIEAIAIYYSIDHVELKYKAEKFMAEGKTKAQGNYIPRKKAAK